MTIDIEQMCADMDAGTPGPWTWETESGEWPDHSLIGGDGDPILEWDMDLGFRFNVSEDARRIARLPDLEAAYLAQAEKLARLREAADALVDACESVFDNVDAVGTYEFYTAIEAYQAARGNP